MPVPDPKYDPATASEGLTGEMRHLRPPTIEALNRRSLGGIRCARQENAAMPIPDPKYDPAA